MKRAPALMGLAALPLCEPGESSAEGNLNVCISLIRP